MIRELSCDYNFNQKLKVSKASHRILALIYTILCYIIAQVKKQLKYAQPEKGSAWQKCQADCN